MGAFKTRLLKYEWVRRLNYKRHELFLRKAEHILPADHCFQSSLVHVNTYFTQKHWPHLFRGYDDEAFIKESIQRIRAFTMCTYDALVSLSAIVRYLEERNTLGAFVETGVCRGGSAALMALVSLKWGRSERRLHLFDSFKGLPRPIKDYDDWTAQDWGIRPEDCDGRLVSTGALVAGLEEAQEAIFSIAGFPKERVTFHVGWFQNTVPEAAAAIGPIALLRLDGDLYESTMVCLRHLYPLVNPGGFVIIDDWGLKGCRKACEAYFDEIGIKPYVHHVDALVRYIVKD